MCIRDSRYVSGNITHSGQNLVDRRSELIAGQHPFAVVVGSVSYTHLRAHETVLDLVCRLLLEKKNNTQMMKEQSLLPLTMKSPVT